MNGEGFLRHIQVVVFLKKYDFPKSGNGGAQIGGGQEPN